MGAAAHTVGGVTATTVNRWAGSFAAKAPPESFFAISAVFHYLGPAFAVLLFARVEVLGVAWLRIASAALIFAVWRNRGGRSPRSIATASVCSSPGAPSWR